MSKDDDEIFQEMVSSLSLMTPLRKARKTLGNAIHSSCFVQMVIDSLDEDEGLELDELMMKALDVLNAACEVFLSIAEEWEDSFLDASELDDEEDDEDDD